MLISAVNKECDSICPNNLTKFICRYIWLMDDFRICAECYIKLIIAVNNMRFHICDTVTLLAARNVPTWMVSESDADPPLPSLTVAMTSSTPVSVGAVQRIDVDPWSDALSDPDGWPSRTTC